MEYRAILLTASCLLLGGVTSQAVPGVALPRQIAMGVIKLEREYMNAPNDDYSGRKRFDFVVVGGGAAGCVLAARLSENGRHTVLLLEAGEDETASMAIPAMASSQRFASDWLYTLEPQAAGCPLGPTGRCVYPRGKTLGGSTVTNAMMYVRGHADDYDAWAELGNEGWGYSDVLPFFTRSERVQIEELRNSSSHGTKGPLPISYAPFASHLTDLVFEAADEKGIPRVDYNGGQTLGVSRVQTTTLNGERWSANRAFLFHTKQRINLFVRKRSMATRVLMDVTGMRAIGVRYERDNATHEAFATKEVILCAGAINTPQLLMVSGIGPRAHLQDLGIPVLKDLPVGQNLMDHTMFLGQPLVFNQSVAPSAEDVFYNPQQYVQNVVDYVTKRQGLHTSIDSVEMLYFFQAGQPKYKSASNMEMYLLQFPPIINYGNTNVNIYQNLTGKHSSVPILMPLQPISKGNVTLASKDVHVQPKISPNFLSKEQDVLNAIAGIKKMLELFETKAFQKFDTKLFDEKLPTCEDYEFRSDEYWECALKHFSLTNFHPCCTCRMGPREDLKSVVDPKLRVKGIRNLRIADASVFPSIVSGHTEAATLMVAEKAAELILRFT